MRLQQARLEQLVKQLGAERSMGRKLRLLAGAWPLLQELSPKQRERVALATGSRWAWRHLERLAKKDGSLSASERQVKRILESLETADPDELREMAREVRAGGSKGVKSRMLAALEQALEAKEDGQSSPDRTDSGEEGDGESEASWSAEGGEGSGGVGGERREPTPGRGPGARAATGAAAATAVAAAAAGDRARRHAGVSSEQRQRRPTPGETAPPMTPPSRGLRAPGELTSGPRGERDHYEPPTDAVPPLQSSTAPPPPPQASALTSETPPLEERQPQDIPEESAARAHASTSTRTPHPESVVGDSGPAGSRPQPTPDSGAPHKATSRAHAEPGTTPIGTQGPPESGQPPFPPQHRDSRQLSAVDSLRALRNLSRGDDLTATGSDRARSAFVANLGSSWAARRAVTAMIRSHSIADVDEALSLIARLPTPSQRGWCLADLLEHWQVDNRDLDKILAAAPGEAVRRRLHRRAERATA